ncbi:MAG: hypothetical protein PUC06_06030 [Oscillospiraceae bacterium]|nr:hypothetical protein [Oscillospiraceae bacterium]
MAVTLIFAVFMFWFLSVWGSWGRETTETESAPDKPMLEQALIEYNEVHNEYELHIWDEAYEAEPYVEVVNSDVRNTFPALSFSPVTACRETERGVLYYATIEGCPGWIVGFYGNELPAATHQNVEAICKAAHETKIPAWIEETRETAINAISPGSCRDCREDIRSRNKKSAPPVPTVLKIFCVSDRGFRDAWGRWKPWKREYQAPFQ